MEKSGTKASTERERIKFVDQAKYTSETVNLLWLAGKITLDEADQMLRERIT